MATNLEKINNEESASAIDTDLPFNLDDVLNDTNDTLQDGNFFDLNADNSNNSNSTDSSMFSNDLLNNLTFDDSTNAANEVNFTNNLDNFDNNVNAGSDTKVETNVDIGSFDDNINTSVTEHSNLRVRLSDAPPDFFTLLLGLALTAIIIASILLFLEVNSYGPDPLSGLPR
ncbi:MAG: hypothetical protein LBE18_02675 [Planctomycetaceae bacterium]|jgi:hypothetical protein|nr:hypothetical protein [Planctomycetaceae bacterium]